MNKTFAAVAVLAALAATPAAAQNAAPASAVTMVAPSSAVIRAGTPVSLRLLEEVTTKEKQARVGQRFRMEVASPVEYNGVVVIPAGSPAEGEITSVRNKGMWGKSGHLGARALWARVNGRQIRLAGTFDDKGVTGTAGVVGAIALVPIAGFFVTGTSAVLPNGGEVAAFLDEDIELAVSTAPVAPMQVVVPAAAEATIATAD
ncbi:hypothetical protein [Parafrankia sp. BMG5.11]|uniref:hypothetical protein n=1 Tax=Parafrankia sp. BMG5.11 TaxID=222540 RepID=UPI001A9DBF31|nr:hypothetical protein [Parafrankia sp. BMG5.11]